MIGIPFGGSAIETPRILPLAVCQPPFGSRKRLAGGADSPRKPISAQTVSDKGHYVNPGWLSHRPGCRGGVLKLIENHNKVFFHKTNLIQVVAIHIGALVVALFYYAWILVMLTGYAMGIFHHMYFTHRSFKARPWVEKVGAILGTLSWRGPFVGPLQYVAMHRGHHSIQITVDTYGHLVPGGNRQAVDKLDDAEGVKTEDQPQSGHKIVTSQLERGADDA